MPWFHMILFASPLMSSFISTSLLPSVFFLLPAHEGDGPVFFFCWCCVARQLVAPTSPPGFKYVSVSLCVHVWLAGKQQGCIYNETWLFIWLLSATVTVYLPLTSGFDWCEGCWDSDSWWAQRPHSSSHHPGVGQILQAGNTCSLALLIYSFPQTEKTHIFRLKRSLLFCFPLRCLAVSPCFCGPVPSSVSWHMVSRL